jgi:hypothetical protein
MGFVVFIDDNLTINPASLFSRLPIIYNESANVKVVGSIDLRTLKREKVWWVLSDCYCGI